MTTGRLPRPNVPFGNRVQVAERQYFEKYGHAADWGSTGKPPSLKYKLTMLLRVLFDLRPAQLHHRPALLNRLQINGKYHPDANDPNFLVYQLASDHDIETRVRGPHGDYSDLAKARKRKRKQRKETMRRAANRPNKKKPRLRKLRGRGFDKTRTRKFSGKVVPRKR